jgi:hypothetical protein
MPVPRTAEQAVPGGELHEAEIFAHLVVVVVGVKPSLFRVEGFGSFHVRDGERYQFELPFHVVLLICDGTR